MYRCDKDSTSESRRGKKYQSKESKGGGGCYSDVSSLDLALLILHIHPKAEAPTTALEHDLEIKQFSRHYRTKISRAVGQDPPQGLARLEDTVPKRITPLVERLARLLGPLLPLPELRRQHRVHARELQL